MFASHLIIISYANEFSVFNHNVVWLKNYGCPDLTLSPHLFNMIDIVIILGRIDAIKFLKQRQQRFVVETFNVYCTPLCCLHKMCFS